MLLSTDAAGGAMLCDLFVVVDIAIGIGESLEGVLFPNGREVY